MATRHRKRRVRQTPAVAPPVSRGRFRRLLLPAAVLGLCVIGLAVFLARRTAPPEAASSPAAMQPVPGNARPAPSSQEPATVSFGPAESVAQIEAEERRLAAAVQTDFPRSAETCLLLGGVVGDQGDLEKRVTLWQEALKLDPRRADIHDKLAQHFRDQGDNEQALAHWEQALALDPEDEGVCWSMANIYLENKQPDLAVQRLERACAINPRTTRNHYLLGQAYLELKQYEKARTHFEKTLALTPTHASAYYGLARVLRFLQEPELAKTYLVKFRELKQTEDGSLAEADTLDDLSAFRARLVGRYVQVYRLYRDSGQPARGLPYLQRVLALDPDHTRALELLGVHYASARQYAQARAVYQRALQYHPRRPMYAVNIGKTYALENQNARAEQIFRKIIQEHPRYALAYTELARLYLRTQWNLPQAVVLAQKAVSLDPSAMNYYYLCWAHDVNGQYAEALEAIRQALVLAPDHERYRQLHAIIQAKM